MTLTDPEEHTWDLSVGNVNLDNVLDLREGRLCHRAMGPSWSKGRGAPTRLGDPWWTVYLRVLGGWA